MLEKTEELSSWCWSMVELKCCEVYKGFLG